MRILHLPSNAGGNAIGLAQGERALDLDSTVLSLTKNPFQYSANIEIDLQDKNLLLQLFSRIKTFAKYRNGFDVYHFNFGSTLLHAPQFGLNLVDLPFYDKSSRIIFTYQGCDARQKYPTITRCQTAGSAMAACFNSTCYKGMCNSGKRDTWRRKAIDKVAKYAQHIFALNPDLLYFLPKELTTFLPYTIANYADIKIKTTPFFKDDKIRIVHAPTDRAAKGSDYILTALQSLKNEFGERIIIDIVENLPHKEALVRYQQADLFIDQMLIGWYGAVAVEVMKMGIPVAVFVNPEHLQFIPAAMAKELPFLPVTIFNLQEKIRAFIKQRDMAIELAASGISFVEKWHDPLKIAEITKSFYKK
ncbi:glycosyltransferase family 4 protein [soil metagenome]